MKANDNLEEVLVRNGRDHDGQVVASANKVSGTGLLRLTLQAKTLTLGLGLLTLLLISLDARQKIITALAMVDVFDADVDALLHVTIADALVDDDTDGVWRDVVDDTGAAVVEFVGHATVFRRVRLDIDNVADTVDLHVGGEFDGAMVAEGPLEEVASARTITKG